MSVAFGTIGGCGVNALSALRVKELVCRPDKTRQRRIRHCAPLANVFNGDAHVRGLFRDDHHDRASLHDSHAHRLYAYPSHGGSHYHDATSGSYAIHNCDASSHGRASDHRPQ